MPPPSKYFTPTVVLITILFVREAFPVESRIVSKDPGEFKFDKNTI